MNILTGLGVAASVLLGIAALITALTGRDARRDAREVADVSRHLTALEAVVTAQGEQIEELKDSNHRFVTALGNCRANNRILIGAFDAHGLPLPELRFDDTY